MRGKLTNKCSKKFMGLRSNKHLAKRLYSSLKQPLLKFIFGPVCGSHATIAALLNSFSSSGLCPYTNLLASNINVLSNVHCIARTDPYLLFSCCAPHVCYNHFPVFFHFPLASFLFIFTFSFVPFSVSNRSLDCPGSCLPAHLHPLYRLCSVATVTDTLSPFLTPDSTHKHNSNCTFYFFNLFSTVLHVSHAAAPLIAILSTHPEQPTILHWSSAPCFAILSPFYLSTL